MRTRLLARAHASARIARLPPLLAVASVPPPSALLHPVCLTPSAVRRACLLAQLHHSFFLSRVFGLPSEAWECGRGSAVLWSAVLWCMARQRAAPPLALLLRDRCALRCVYPGRSSAQLRHVRFCRMFVMLVLVFDEYTGFVTVL